MSHPKDVPASSRPPYLPNGRSLRIFYVNDFSALRDVARTSFGRLGHSLECATHARNAIESIVADPGIDLVIVEHEMPDMSGTELVAHLRNRGYAGKIIVLSSDLSEAAEAEYHRLNVDRVLFKPVLPSALRTSLSELFPGSGRVG